MRDNHPHDVDPLTNNCRACGVSALSIHLEAVHAAAKVEARRASETNALDAYQTKAMRTAPMKCSPEIQLATFGLGVAGEAGEVADLIKKHLGHGHALDRDKLRKELGDVLWYVAGIAHLHGMPLSEVATANIVKLQARYPNGFSSEASINRPQE